MNSKQEAALSGPLCHLHQEMWAFNSGWRRRQGYRGPSFVHPHPTWVGQGLSQMSSNLGPTPAEYVPWCSAKHLNVFSCTLTDTSSTLVGGQQAVWKRPHDQGIKSYAETAGCAPLQYFCLENPMDGGAWWVIYSTCQSFPHPRCLLEAGAPIAGSAASSVLVIQPQVLCTVR